MDQDKESSFSTDKTMIKIQNYPSPGHLVWLFQEVILRNATCQGWQLTQIFVTFIPHVQNDVAFCCLCIFRLLEKVLCAGCPPTLKYLFT